MSGISTTITTGITLGSGGYASPLTIAATGAVVYSGSTNAVYGVGTLVNFGTIAQGGANPTAGYAVYLLDGGAVTNGQAGGSIAVIEGWGGVAFSAGSGAAAGTVANDGSILGGQDVGVILGAGGNVTNGATNDTTASIQGYGAGISSLGSYNAQVSNFATIQASDLVRGSYGILVQGSGTISNLGTDALITGDGGVSINLAGTVINAGIIAALPGGATAVMIQGAGYVDNTGPSALIEGYGGVTIGLAGSVTNAGTIAVTANGGVYFGVDIGGAGSVANTGTDALISGYHGGIAIGLAGTVSNAGTIMVSGIYGRAYAIMIGGTGVVSNLGATSTIEGQGGVSIAAGGTVMNAGTILSNYYRSNFGVFIGGGGYIGNQGTGALIAGYGGAYAGQLATVSNFGTIESNEYSALGDNFGVKLADGGTVINSGTGSLLYGSVALYVENGGGTVTNYGAIEADEGLGTGVRLTAGGTIANGAANDTTAAIYGTQYGVLVTAGAATIANFGAISGSGVGLDLHGGGTIVDSGYISGGEAIYLGGTGGNLLVLQPGYVISGGIVAGGTANVLELQGNVTASVTANYTSLGLSGFQTVAFAPGAGGFADLIIANAGEMPGTIAGFTGLNDRIDLTGLSDAGDDASVSFNAGTGVLTVTADGGATAELQLAVGNYGTVTWAAANDGSNGTEIYRTSGGAPNQRPSISGIAGGIGIVSGTSATPFGAVVIHDTSSAPTDTVTVTLSNTTGGTLADFGTGSFDTTTGVYTATGTPAVVTSDVEGLEFTPSAPTSGSVGPTTGFTIAVTGPGGSASDATTSVTAITQVLNVATSGTIATSVSPDGSSFAAYTPDDTNEAVVLNPTTGNTYVLPAHYQAEFLGASADAVTLSDTSVGDALLVGNAAGDTISSSTANDTLLGGGGTPTLQFVPGARDGVASVAGGSVLLQDAGSYDTLFGGSATTSATLSGSNGTFLGQTGVSSVVASGQGNILSGGSSQAMFQVTAAATNTAVYGGAGTLTLSDSGGSDTTQGALGASNVTLSGAHGLFFGTSGSASVVAGGASDTLVGGSGNSSMTMQGSADVVLGGGGSLAVLDSSSGDTISPFGASSAQVSITGGNALLLGGSHALTASLAGTGATVAAGSGAAQITIANIYYNSNDLVFGGAGSLTIADAGQHDTIAAFSASSANMSIGGAHDLLLGGSGPVGASIGGASDTIIGGGGALSISVGAGANGAELLGGAGAFTANDHGSNDTIAPFGASTASVTVAGSGALVFGGNHATSVDASGSGATIVAGAGALAVTAAGGGTGPLVVGSAATLNFVGGTANATVIAAAGDASIAGGSGGVMLFGGAGGSVTYTGATGSGLYYNAGSGNETLYAGLSTTNNVMFGGADTSGHNSIVGGQGAGQGNDTLVAGGGADTLVGNVDVSSQDWFVFFAANGGAAPHDEVANFTASDSVLLVGYGANAVQTALGSANSNGGATTITLSDNTTIVFTDVASASDLTGHIMAL